jgi:hypothetical protein
MINFMDYPNKCFYLEIVIFGLYSSFVLKVPWVAKRIQTVQLLEPWENEDSGFQSTVCKLHSCLAKQK